jgi:hypothetical protein
MRAGPPIQLAVPAGDESIRELPPGYPAYCVYIPTGMELDFEKDTIAKLKVWSKSMRENLCVAPWNIGDPSYLKLLQLITRIRLNNKQAPIRRPAIIMTDNNMPDENSFMIILDDQRLLTDSVRLSQILPYLIDSIFLGEKKEAMKEAVKASKSERISQLLKGVEAALSKVKVTFAWGGLTVEATG